MPFVGNNVFNATGLRQTASVENYNELEGAYYSFDISIQNDGNRSDRFKVKATGTATSGWKVAYFRGTTNITSAIVAGTFQTSSLAPSATYLIRAQDHRRLRRQSHTPGDHQIRGRPDQDRRGQIQLQGRLLRLLTSCRDPAGATDGSSAPG